jgi:hypothetical protein
MRNVGTVLENNCQSNVILSKILVAIGIEIKIGTSSSSIPDPNMGIGSHIVINRKVNVTANRIREHNKTAFNIFIFTVCDM